MARYSTEELPSDAPIMSRSTMNYVKWKHKAQKSQQLLVISAILLGATTIGIVLFVLLISGMITAGPGSQVKISKHMIGSSRKGEEIHRYTLTNDHGLTFSVMTLGCAVTSLTTPDRSGQSENVLLGQDTVQAINSVVGRIASSHTTGWEQVVCVATAGSDYVMFSHVSAEGDQGFPGEIHANVSFSLTNDNQVVVMYSATVRGKPSPIDISSYLHFNLAGQANSNISDHEIAIFADEYLRYNLPVSAGIPTGQISKVEGTYYDLRTPTLISTKVSHLGFSQNHCLRGPTGKRLAARVIHSPSGRTLEVYTDQPSLHLSFGTPVDISTDRQYAGLSLASQNYPHAVSHRNFPDCVLHPGSTYSHTTWYRFGTNG